MRKITFLPIVSFLFVTVAQTLLAANTGKHLFILSGQSNMAGIDPALSFTPTVEQAFGAENVIVVHDAEGGTEIGAWLLPEPGSNNKKAGRFYERLMKKVGPAIEEETLASVTFIWMQGERDSHQKVMNGDGYAEDFTILMSQLNQDLGREDLFVVLGRINDFGLLTTKGKAKYPHWTKVREAQVTIAESNPRFDWVDTDDLNNWSSIQHHIHASEEGYVILGQRFADKAVEQIRLHQN